jgi:hypothetical protein
MSDLQEHRDENDKFYYDEFDRGHWHNNCLPSIGNSIPEEKRRALAESFGPNWANVISGLGDQ